MEQWQKQQIAASAWSTLKKKAKRMEPMHGRSSSRKVHARLVRKGKEQRAAHARAFAEKKR